jgi:hypothetical protein
VVAHLPWLLLATDRVLRGDDRRRAAWWGVGLGLLTASQLLLGHPQYVWFSILAEGLYGLWVISRAPRRVGRAWVWAGVKVLGVLAGAVQLAPTWDGLAASYRSQPPPAFRGFLSLPPGNLALALAPYLYRARVYAPEGSDTPLTGAENLGHCQSHEFGLYNGAVVPVLVAWLLLRGRAVVRGRSLSRAAGVLAVVSLVLALGRYTPIFQVTSRLPVFHLFRAPARYVVLYHLATPILAAVAIADLARVSGSRREERPSWRKLSLLALVPAAAALVPVGAKALSRVWPVPLIRPVLGCNSELILGAVLVGGMTGLVALSARGWRWALVALLLVAAGDMGLYSVSYVRHIDPVPIRAFQDVRTVPVAVAGQRIKQQSMPFFDNCWTMNGLSLVDGYGALVPRRELGYEHPAAWRLAAATWVLTSATWYVHGPLDATCWKPIPDPLPRARLRSRVVVTRTPIAVFRTIDPKTTAMVDRPVSLTPGEPGTASIVSDRPGAIRVVAEAPSTQLLVVAESYHKGWRIELDGRPVETLRADGDFLGCVVPEGRHRVELAFDPRSLRWGRRVSVAGLGMLLACLAVTLRRTGGRWMDEDSHIDRRGGPPFAGRSLFSVHCPLVRPLESAGYRGGNAPFPV